MEQVITQNVANSVSFEGVTPLQILTSDIWYTRSENCSFDIVKIVNSVNNFELWSLKFLDSSTKLPNGILTGNLIDLGNYDECLEITIPDSHTTGQYCLANLSLNQTILNIPNDFGVIPSLTWSYCIPSSCSSEDLQSVLNSSWFNLTGGEARLTSSDCHAKENITFSPTDIFSISFFGIFLLLCVASTIYDSLKKEKKNALLGSFSIISNGKRLLHVQNGGDTMKTLNGLRFLSIAWVVLGHRYFFAVSSPLLNTLDVADARKTIAVQFVANGVLAVDTFFLMSGLLNSYHLLKLMDKTKKFPYFKYYIHRYLRTTPVLAIVIFIYATWFVKLGSGPLWNKTVEPWKQLCVNNWWPTILYINNYYNPVEQCAGQSWYLAADMQMYWIAPLVIIPIWRWPKISNYYFAILLVLSIAIQFAIAYIDKIRMAFTITQDLVEYKRVTEDIYVPTHTRATPYIIGLMLGQFLFTLRKSNRRPSVTKLAVFAGWGLSTVLCLAVIIGNYPFFQSEQDHPYDRIESTMYIGFHRLAWGASISWIIFACLYGYGGIINSILSWNIFVPLSRLTYCIFLTHMLIQMYQIATTRTSFFYSPFDQVHRYFGDLLMAILLSAIFCLIFESPISTIEKYFASPREPKKQMDGERNKSFVAEE